jgi:hypothetical protein
MVPKDAKRVSMEKDFIIGDSETKGNFHMCAVKEGVEIYEKDGTLYIKNDVDTEIFCPNKTRHDTVVLPAGEWEVKKAREFDYLSNSERQVRD